MTGTDETLERKLANSLQQALATYRGEMNEPNYAFVIADLVDQNEELLLAALSPPEAVGEGGMSERMLSNSISVPTASLWLMWVGSICLSVSLHKDHDALSRLFIMLGWIAWTLANFAPKREKRP